MIQRLTKENYLEVENYKNQIDPNIQTSAFSLLIWNFYGYDIYWEYFKKENIVIFYAKANSELYNIESKEFCDFLANKYFVIYTYFQKTKNNLAEIIDIANVSLIKNFGVENIINVIGALDLECYQNSSLQLKHEQLFQWYANFLYETNSLKSFGGKKLQKKRNNLNYFIREHADQYYICKYNHIDDYNDVINFFNEWNVKNFEQSQAMMKKSNLFILDILNDQFLKKHFVASIIRSKTNNKVVGFSVVYIYANIAEILIEMADRDIRGMYQFLLSQNIIINNIKNELIDRQDEAWSKNIAHSKLSYCPIVATKRVSIILK